MSESDLRQALEALVDEIDRLVLIGDGGRRKRGVPNVSTETLRYLRQSAVDVATGAAEPESLRGVAATLSVGCDAGAPLLECAQRLESLV